MAYKLPDPKMAVLEKDGLRVVLGGNEVVAISLDGVPFTDQSTFFVVKPKWDGRYYGYGDDRRALERATATDLPDGGKRVSVPLRDKEGTFEGTQVIEVLPGRVFRMTCESRMTTSAIAFLEHRIGGLHPLWLSGRPYKVTRGGKVESGVAPSVPRSGDRPGADIAVDIEKIEIDTRVGPVSINITGDGKLGVLDYRINKWSLVRPHYFLGVLESGIPEGKPFTYTVEMRFPAARSASPQAIESKAAVTPEGDMLKPAKGTDRIFPTPKKVTWGTDGMTVGPKSKILVSAGAADAAKLAPGLDAFTAEIAKDYGVRLRRDRVAPSAKIAPAGAIQVVVAKEALPAPVKNGEQYRVKVSADSAVVSAATPEGAANALKTLRQLLRQENDRVYLRACEVDDYPSLPFRGIHFFSGKDARELQVKMVRDIMGALKINWLVYQCEYVKWDSLKKVHSAKFGMEKVDAAAVRDEARRQGIEIVPLVNTMGHSEWLISNDVYRHLADNPDEPYSYDPSNPEVYRICEAVYDEVITFFRPKWFHIGKDEITMEGFPHKPANKKVGATQLILNDIKHYYDFLKKRGVETMIWGDMFIAPGESPDSALAGSKAEAQRRRDLLPKDIFICDWHYDPSAVEAFTSLKVFNANGFDTVGGTWFDPVNIINFTQACARRYEDSRKETVEAGKRLGRTLGILQTTWAGYSFDETSFEENPDQYASYFLAAEAAWTGAPVPFDKMNLDYRAEFARMWSANLLPAGKTGGWTVDLGGVANLDLKNNPKEWLGLIGKGGMGSLPVGAQSLGRVRYQIAGEPGNPRAVLLAGRHNPAGDWPARLDVPVGRKAGVLAFAVAASVPGATNPAIARTTVTYDDGTTAGFDWKLAQNVFPVDDLRASAVAPVVWSEAPNGEIPRAVHEFAWKNPKPSKGIRSISFQSTAQASGLILFGLGGLETR